MVNSTRFPWLTMAAVAAVVGGSGCTTQLEATRIATATDVPVAGAPYYLPFTQFTIGITRRVTRCGSPGLDEKGNALPETIDITVIPTISRAEMPDPQRLYVIDFNSLQSALKKTNVKVQYHPNGMLKAVNAAAEDRTGPVVIGAVTTAAKLAVSVATGQRYSLFEAGRKPFGCSADVLEALATIKDQAPKIEPTAAAVTRLAGELASLTAQGQVLGKAWGPEGRALWAKKQQDLSDAQAALTTLQSNVAAALAKLSVVEAKLFVWPKTGEDRGPTQVPVAALTDEQIATWGNFDQDAVKAIQTPTLVYVSLTSTSPIARTTVCLAGDAKGSADPECARDDSTPGLKYRVPAEGSLRLCETAACETGTAIKTVSGPINQLGPIFTLPLRSAVFTNKTVSAVFDEQGRPMELGVVSSAAAEEAVATAAGVTDTVLKARDSVVTTRLERLKAETEILKAEKELAAAQQALAAPTEQQTELVALQADTALLTARLANLQAQEALQKAQQLAAGL
jgi:hypothetical protein